jgi:hypothetical protein
MPASTLLKWIPVSAKSCICFAVFISSRAFFEVIVLTASAWKKKRGDKKM